MGEERKEYSIIGTVTIGTDEYRDLIEDKASAQKESEERRHKWYEEYSRNEQLEKELKELKETLERYDKFIHSDNMYEKYKLYLVSISED